LSVESRYRYSRAGSQERSSYDPSLFSGLYLNDSHARIQELVKDVPGKLQPTDHLKLYEMAHLARGPILEVGRDAEKSLAILAIAVRDAGSHVPIYSIELRDRKLPPAERNLKALNLADLVTLLQGDSADEIAALDTNFDLVFLDGDHRHEGVKRDLRALAGRITPGGSMMAHDYFDPRNDGAGDEAYGVRAAIDELAPGMGLEYRGGYGAIALFEQVEAAARS